MSIFVTNHTMLTFGSETKMSNQEKIEEYQHDVLALVEQYKKDIEDNRLQYEAKNKKLVEKLQAAMEVVRGANPLEKLNIIEGQSVN